VSKRDKNGERRLHNEELHSLYCLHNIATVTKYRRLRWAHRVTRIEVGWFALGRSKREDNIRMDFIEIDVNTGN
jgi:hypothetical protein